MLELLNFLYMASSRMYFESPDKIMLVTTWTEIFQSTFISRRRRVANFVDIIKIGTMFIKATFKDSKRLKEVEILY